METLNTLVPHGHSIIALRASTNAARITISLPSENLTLSHSSAFATAAVPRTIRPMAIAPCFIIKSRNSLPPPITLSPLQIRQLAHFDNQLPPVRAVEVPV
jgi:hypothetical protein